MSQKYPKLGSALDTSTDAYVMYDSDVIIMVTGLLAAGAAL